MTGVDVGTKDAYGMIPFIWSYRTGTTELRCLEMHYLVNTFFKKKEIITNVKIAVTFGGGGRERLTIFGIPVIFCFFTWVGLLYYYLLNFTYTFYVLFCSFQNKIKTGEWSVTSNVVDRSVRGELSLDHWG